MNREIASYESSFFSISATLIASFINNKNIEYLNTVYKEYYDFNATNRNEEAVSLLNNRVAKKMRLTTLVLRNKSRKCPLILLISI